MSDANLEKKLSLANIELNEQITLLKKVILEKDRGSKTLEDSEKRYRRLFESAQDGILILDAKTGQVVDVNPFLAKLLGYTFDEFCGKHIWEIGSFKDIAASKDAFKVLQDNEYIRYEDLPLETQKGQSIAVEFVSNVYLVDNHPVIQCNIRDITAHKLAKAERKRLMAAIEQMVEIIVMTDAQGNILFVNQAFESTTGYTREEAVGNNPRFFKSGEQDDFFYKNLWKTISCGKTWSGRMVNKRKDGTLYTEESTISPIREASGQISSYVAVKRDITDQLRLSAQFQQIQKMEAVGLLAGGVAHDYNNMLSVILGFTELAMNKVEPDHPIHYDLEGIYKAAMHSADITRQLLAFARKQTISPLVIDLNNNVKSMLKMLGRLIGENIEIAWLPDKERCQVKMDPVQLDQILANLCVNARDAISDNGRITIETGNKVFDEAYCADHAGFVPGEFVLLAVSDDGCGMDKEILDHIFEPFFTSKGLGKGSGLGLSTVHGIVKQNNGFINVYSELGDGTTFKIYLPRNTGESIDICLKKIIKNPVGQGETILVVEDEPMLLEIDNKMLGKLGYRVLAAGTPGKALSLAEEHAGEIHLVITDVVMPEMNGQHLAKGLQSLYPGIKILFMSGYTADVISHKGVLDEAMNFIQKPFSMNDLAIKVRMILDNQVNSDINEIG